MTRSNLGLGFKRYTLKLSTGQPTAQVLSGFDRGYGINLHYGAPWIRSIEIYAAQSSEPTVVDRFDLRDGWKLPVPGGFKRLVVNLKDDVILGASRVVLDVYTVPGMIETRTDPYTGLAARRIFPAAGIHPEPGSLDSVTLPAGAGQVVKLCEVIGDLYQGENSVGYFPSTGNAFYSSRFFGDDGNQVYPTPALYFDGWVSSSVASNAWKLWILACRINFQGAPRWVVYKEIASTLPAAVPAGITQDGGLSIATFWNPGAVSVPIPIPPDGFQIWAENTDAVAKLLRGNISGRTA